MEPCGQRLTVFRYHDKHRTSPVSEVAKTCIIPLYSCLHNERNNGERKGQSSLTVGMAVAAHAMEAALKPAFTPSVKPQSELK